MKFPVNENWPGSGYFYNSAFALSIFPSVLAVSFLLLLASVLLSVFAVSLLLVLASVLLPVFAFFFAISLSTIDTPYQCCLNFS